MDRDYVLALIAIHLPSENFEATLATLGNWGRFGDLFSYDEQPGVLTLSEEIPQAA